MRRHTLHNANRVGCAAQRCTRFPPQRTGRLKSTNEIADMPQTCLNFVEAAFSDDRVFCFPNRRASRRNRVRGRAAHPTWRNVVFCAESHVGCAAQRRTRSLPQHRGRLKARLQQS
ncbi:hypothetical protein [Kingella potus]|uniref:hypothetical protein n=1 Tax=Kingella potus TaxID=265175 RepID=UPI001FD21600|nr:hypothetical protein [Kingella potus]UOP01360.1 hypothetical protein LVJ84_03735 [Kingella potus]